MFKKTALGLGGVMLVATLVMGPTTTWSHVQGLFAGIGDWIEDSTPPEYDLERAERMLAEVEPEIANDERAVAEKKVDLEILRDKLATMRSRAEGLLHEIAARNADLKSLKVSRRTRSEIATKQSALETRIAQYESTKANLARMERTIAAHESALAAAQKRLAARKEEKERLALAIQELRAQLAEIQATESANSRTEVDSSALAEVRDLVKRLQRDMKVEKQLQTDRGLDTVPPLEAPGKADVIERAEALLSRENATDAE